MGDPRQGRSARWAAVPAALWLCAFPLAASSAVLDDLSGSWAEAAAGPPTMAWAKADDGFSVSWTPPGAAATTVQFSSAGRPGVYAGNANQDRSMMDSMFGENAPVNPLAGGALYWARVTDDGVYVYSLVIDDSGLFQIDRYACRPDGGALDVSLQRRTGKGADEPVEKHLVRVAQ
jgi:hypothetical protein